MTGGEDLHEALAWGLLALVGVHVVAVLLTSLVTRDNLVRAMITGSKKASRHPGGRDARGAAWYALPVSGAFAALAAFGATTIDPLAFQPHRSGGEDGGASEQAQDGDTHAGATEDEDD